MNFVFNDAFTLGGGNVKVPGTREWTESNRYTLGADRTMATTFFRPSVSPGVRMNGEPLHGFFHYAGVCNSLHPVGPAANRANTNMSYTTNMWWEPLGEFGPGYSDQEYHGAMVVKTGGSLSYQRTNREPDLAAGTTNPENTILSLSDGTPIYQVNSLGPGVTLWAADVLPFSYDLGFKYRGFSLSGEYFARGITSSDS